MVLSEQSGDHVFVGHRGDLLLPADKFPERWKSIIQAADALCIDGWNYLSIGPDVNLIAIEIAKKADIPIFYDPGPWISQMPASWRDSMLAECTVILLTQDEAEIAVGESLPPEQLAQQFANSGQSWSCSSKGQKGC